MTSKPVPITNELIADSISPLQRLRPGDVLTEVVVYKHGDELWMRVEFDGQRHGLNLSAKSVGPTLVSTLKKWAAFVLVNHA